MSDKIGLIESDTTYCYSYPSITWDGDDVLLTYYQWSRAQGNKNFQMTDLVFRKINAEWFFSRMKKKVK